jgi:hypothetical protein
MGRRTFFVVKKNNYIVGILILQLIKINNKIPVLGQNLSKMTIDHNDMVKHQLFVKIVHI